MEVICTDHKKLCFIKTGVKDGPNKGRSFYICSNSAQPCKFVKEASFSPMACPVHHGQTVELQSFHTRATSGEKRHCFRCTNGRAEKKNWCGFRIIEQNGGKENAGSQISHQGQGKKTDVTKKPTAPLKDRNQDTKPVQSQPVKKQEHAVKSQPKMAESSKPQDVHGTASNPQEPAKAPPKPDVRPKQPQAAPVHPMMAGLTPQAKANALSKGSAVRRVQKEAADQNSSFHSPRNPKGYNSGQSSSEDSESDDECFIVEQKGSLNDVPLAERIRMKSGNSSSSTSSVSSSSSSSSEEKAQTLKEPKKNMVIQNHPSVKPKTDLPLSTKTTHSATTNLPPGIREVHSTAGVSAAGKLVTVVKGGTMGTGGQGQSQRIIVYPSGFKSSSLGVKLAEQMELTKRIQSQKLVLKSVAVDRLPDRGQRLQGKLDELESALANLNLEIEEDKKRQPVVIKTVNSASQLSSAMTVNSTGATSTVLTASGQQVPMKQTTLLHHATQLPPHVLQQMYAANPQLQSLYGGRMTASRLREVGSVTSEALERLHKQLETCPSPEQELADPDGLAVPLMAHQRQALAWLTWRENQHPAGGILADDMGLGKTLTMISLVLKQKLSREEGTKEEKEVWLSRDKQKEKLKGVIKSSATLVVAPASLVYQWQSEIERRVKTKLNIVTYHGANREKNVLKLAASDIVLTTYNIISKEVGIPEDMKKDKKAQDSPVTDKDIDEEMMEAQPALLRIGWERVILDEAHNIKNHKSLTAMSVSRLRSGFRWALTGTPIQNNLLDMYSLLRFLRCSPFDEFKVWKRQVENEKGRGQKRLNTLVKTLLLRRTKDQTSKAGKPLVSLPTKLITVHEIDLTKEERTIYTKIFEKSKSVVANYLKKHEEKERDREMGIRPVAPSAPALSNPFAGSQASANQGAAQPAVPAKNSGSQMLLILLRLRQCCTHPSLMKDDIDMEAMLNDGLDLDLVEQMRELSVKEAGALDDPTNDPASGKSLSEKSFSNTKVRDVMNKLREIKEGSPKGQPRKSVIVSQWTKMLDIIAYHLDQAGFRYSVIKGDIPPKKRMEIVDDFNSNPKGPTIVLVSLRAGGVGLNLIGGNNLFLLDMHWNPALEAQAIDRVYRLGQKHDVFIHKFVCKDTIEEKIKELQNQKMTLAKNILSGAGAQSQKLSLADLRLLFGLG